MKGDFSRFTFDSQKQYSRVLMQQGHILLDADFNEMVEIHCNRLRNVMRDLIGPHGGPIDNCGFRILGTGTSVKKNEQIHHQELYIPPGDFLIGKGRYYVDGVACENLSETTYCTQPNLSSKPLKMGAYLVYLDVWERHITYFEDPEIREVALEGPDTTTRTKVVWQVRTHKLHRYTDCSAIKQSWQYLTHKWQPKNRGMLSATVKTNPDMLSAAGGYSGYENHLYRIEIHSAGLKNKKPTFKWSRNNGTVAYKIRKIDVEASSNTTELSLDKSSEEDLTLLKPNDWVEVLDDYCVLEAKPGTMQQIIAIDMAKSRVILQGLCSASICLDKSHICLMRLWDQKQGTETLMQDGALVIKEGFGNDRWLDLESGIQIRFEPGGQYRTGDYWLIPTRTASSNIEWPCFDGNPLARPPVGISHHFAPLSIVKIDSLGNVDARDCRLAFRLKLQRPEVVRRKP